MHEALISIGYGALALGIKVIVALSVAYGMLLFANHKNDVKIKNVLDIIHQDPQATAEYYGSRLRSVALIILGIAIGSL